MNRLFQDVYNRKVISPNIKLDLETNYKENMQKYIDDDTLDEIIKNENAMNNKFIKKLIDKNNINKTDDIPNINDIYWLYYDNFNKYNSPDNNIRYLIIFIRIIHIIGIIFLISGFLLPNKLLKYHILWCIKILFLWEIFDKGYIAVLVKYLTNNDNYNEFIPISINACKQLVLIVMLISIYGIINIEYSPFSVIKKLIDYLTIFN